LETTRGTINERSLGDLSAEMAGLGTMVIEERAVITALEIITENDFVKKSNKMVFNLVVNKLYLKQKPNDG
jgi:replicative DNA helicase